MVRLLKFGGVTVCSIVVVWYVDMTEMLALTDGVAMSDLFPISEVVKMHSMDKIETVTMNY